MVSNCHIVQMHAHLFLSTLADTAMVSCGTCHCSEWRNFPVYYIKDVDCGSNDMVFSINFINSYVCALHFTFCMKLLNLYFGMMEQILGFSLCEPIPIFIFLVSIEYFLEMVDCFGFNYNTR